MASSTVFSYRAMGIAELLRTERLAVPPYQRSYSWGTNESFSQRYSTGSGAQVVEYWEDLLASYSSSHSYFLGTIVLSHDDDDPHAKLVIDGQQRLASTSLLMAAIRDQLVAGGEIKTGDSIQADFLSTFDRSTKSENPKILLNTEDRSFYNRRVVDRNESIQPVGVSQRLILEAFEYLRRQVAEFARMNGSNWDNKLNEFASWLDGQAQIVAITVANEADAFTIFETLNDRGADLTTADLLKNLLFKQAGNRLDEVRDNWTVTMNNLTTAQTPASSVFSTFARHLLSSREGLVRQRDVYARLKRSVMDRSDAVSLAQDLRDNSEIYQALDDSSSDYWTQFPRTDLVVASATILAELHIERYRPMVLAALTTFQKSEIAGFLEQLIGWSIRILSVGGLAGGVSESAFCEAARQIRQGEVTSTHQILQKTRVDSLIPSDGVFLEAFKKWTPPVKMSRYLLRCLELAQRGESEPELIVNPIVDQVNLEHILPKRTDLSEWQHFDSDTHKQYVGRLGNHCLLKKGANGRIGSRSFVVKCPILEASELYWTNNVPLYGAWSPSAIEKRQADMANVAIRVWKRI